MNHFVEKIIKIWYLCEWKALNGAVGAEKSLPFAAAVTRRAFL